MAERRPPLEGVRVLAQGLVWAGPFATLILSDLGAEVIEIESIQHLNPTRTNMRHIPDIQMEATTGTYYANRDNSEGFWNRQAWFNYGKRGCKSITLDLNRDEGRELFLRLVEVSDAFLENNAAGVVESLGISWETLSQVNPRLLMVRFPGFGLSGRYAHFKGFGSNMEAVAGHTMLRGYRDADPSATPSSLHGDPNAGALTAFAVQAGLIARERTGEGQLIELSQAEAVAHHIPYDLMDYALNERQHPHWGNRHPSMAPYGVFRCSGDDRWVAIAIPSDEAFAALCEELGQPALAADERFAGVVERHRNQDELDPLVEARTRDRDAHDLAERLQARGAPAMALEHQQELHEDAHLNARGFFSSIEHPAAGTHLYPGPLAQLAHTASGPPWRPAPMLGQHNEEIFRGLLGLSEAEYGRLEDEQLIGDTYLETATP